jgi:K+/H+ antiporter YhaU regulatory subunit KhtT
MLTFATRPMVSDFLDVMLHGHEVEFELDEVKVQEEVRRQGGLTPLDVRRQSGAVPLALIADGEYRTQPSDEEEIQPGMTVIALGTKEQIRTLRRIVDPDGEHRREMQEAGWP